MYYMLYFFHICLLVQAKILILVKYSYILISYSTHCMKWKSARNLPKYGRGRWMCTFNTSEEEAKEKELWPLARQSVCCLLACTKVIVEQAPSMCYYFPSHRCFASLAAGLSCYVEKMLLQLWYMSTVALLLAFHRHITHTVVGVFSRPQNFVQ